LLRWLSGHWAQELIDAQVFNTAWLGREEACRTNIARLLIVNMTGMWTFVILRRFKMSSALSLGSEVHNYKEDTL
jgi:hypothetical protein